MNIQSFSKKPVLFIAFGLIFFIGLAYTGYSFYFQNKFYPNTYLAGIDLGGLNKDEAKKILQEKIDLLKNKEIELMAENQIQTLLPDDFSINYDLEKSLERAFAIGHEQGFLVNFSARIKALYRPINLKISFSINISKLEELLKNLAKDIDLDQKNASLALENGQIVKEKAQIGRRLNQELLKTKIIETITNLEDARIINLPIDTLNPKVLEEDISQAYRELQNLLAKKIIFLSKESSFEPGQEKIMQWIEFVALPYNQLKSNFILSIIFNEEKIKSYIQEIAKQIDQEEENARLSYQGNKIVVIKSAQNGYKIDQTAALKLIVNELHNIKNNNKSEYLDKTVINISLPVSVIRPDVSENNIGELGIKELISTATTSYKGSPENRKHNIKVGSEVFQGVIIKPGEEFSFLKYLGNVTEERGFRKELVIKEDSTIPEVGGGLCQVSTTMFRVALNAGFKITERQNHKYRVSYYEPPIGLDATIYEPSPDLKFLNDTPGYILIQVKIEDDKLTFEFFGTKDSREVSISEPELYDWQSPPETRYIDDPTMLEGESKYKEKAHTGVKAKVNYQVKRDGKIINEQTFYSKYTAWGAVILRGTKKAEETTASEATPGPEATSTPTPEASAQPTT